MKKKKYIYWQDDDMWLGYLEEYPDYMTQAETIEELQDNLRDIYIDLTSGIPIEPYAFIFSLRVSRFPGLQASKLPRGRPQ